MQILNTALHTSLIEEVSSVNTRGCW